MPQWNTGWLTLLVAGWLTQLGHAQPPTVADQRLGVDVLRLADGSQIYGFALDRPHDGSLSFAVERQWLRDSLPELYERLAASERQEARLAQAQLIKQIEEWLAERPANDPANESLRLYLESQLQAVRGINLEDQADKIFLCPNFSKSEIGKLTIQPSDRRHIAGIAYQNNLPQVVTTPTSQLASRLDEIGVQPENEQVDLTDELPGLVRHSPRQWATRQALVEFALREPLEYQGTAQALVRTGQTVDAGALLGELLGGGLLGAGDPISQLGAELGLPEFTQKKPASDWWKPVTQAAERDGFRGVLITRLTQSLLSPVVQVDMVFYAKQSTGEWFQVTSMHTESNANQQSAEQLAALRQDPQVQAALTLLDSLGLAANTQLDQALRHGAATQQGLANARAQWNLFLQRHTRSLSDRPF